MVSNYYSSSLSNSNYTINSNRYYDNMKISYYFKDINEPITIIIYFLNNNIFCNEQKFYDLVSNYFFYNIKYLSEFFGP